MYHPVGIGRMGSDPASVVILHLEVRGVHRLRIVDACVIPIAIRGHTHTPSVLIGAKAADLIAATSGRETFRAGGQFDPVGRTRISGPVDIRSSGHA
jgi:choline dehydrogenase-like flavoprotein